MFAVGVKFFREQLKDSYHCTDNDWLFRLNQLTLETSNISIFDDNQKPFSKKLLNVAYSNVSSRHLPCSSGSGHSRPKLENEEN